MTRIRLAHRLDKVQQGQLVDVKSVETMYFRCVNILDPAGACTLFNVKAW